MTEALIERRELLYVFTQASYSNASGQEGLDAVLVGAAFDQKISLLFLFDGIYQLKVGQDTSESGLKQYTKTFGALKDFDVQNIYASELCVQARGLSHEDLILTPQLLEREAITKLIGQQHRVFTF